MPGEARLVPLVVLSVLAVWLFWEREAGRMVPARPASASVALADAEPLRLRRTTAPARQIRPAHVPASSTAALATPAEGARAALGTDGPEVPHPITPQHEALREQQQLLGALNDALDQRDAVGLRALIERYDAVAPEDPQRLSEGYERVADCLDARDDPARRASARANGQRYYDDARASSLRRYVRRLCLEPGADPP